MDKQGREDKNHSIKDIKTRYADVSRQLKQSNIFKEYKQLSCVMEGLRYCKNKDIALNPDKNKQTYRQKQDFREH